MLLGRTLKKNRFWSPCFKECRWKFSGTWKQFQLSHRQMLVEFSAADLSTLHPGGALPASHEVWAAGLSCSGMWITFHMKLKMCSHRARGAGRWTRLAIWLRESLLGSEQKTHYPQWTKATERWFPLWKPLIPLLWVGGGSGKVEKCFRRGAAPWLLGLFMSRGYLQGLSAAGWH